MTANTTITPDTTGATFERAWAAIEHLSLTTARIEQNFEKSYSELDAAIKSLAVQMEKTGKELGSFTNKFGSLVEEFMAAGIVKKFQKLGYEFEICSPNRVVRSKQLGIETEIDAWLENGEYTLAAEFKAELTIDYIDHHLERLTLIRRHADLHHDQRKILGAVGGIKISLEAKNYAIKHGLYVLSLSGESITIANDPKNFVPRKW
jgi:hypothetical protein